MDTKQLLSPKTLPDGSDGSKVEHGAGGTAFVGAGAVDTFRAITLASTLGLLAVGLKVRGVTLTRALVLAREYTGETFPRTKEGAKRAADAVRAWAQAARRSMEGEALVGTCACGAEVVFRPADKVAHELVPNLYRIPSHDAPGGADGVCTYSGASCTLER